jgi:RND superfamily putative drug exporter
LLLLVLGGLFARGLGDVVNSNLGLYFNPESIRASHLLDDRLRGPKPASEVVMVQSADETVDDPDFEAFVGGLLTSIRDLKNKDGSSAVASVASFYDARNAAFVSADRHTTVLPVTMNAPAEESATSAIPLIELLKEYNGRDGFTVLTSGEGSLNNEWNAVAQKDLRTAELIGVPVALVVLVLVFGAVVAAGVPLVLAAFAIVIALGATALIGRVLAMDTIVENMITMVGLAVGIDYSLLVVERFREERRGGREKVDAIAVAGATASKAVLFSGGTVIVSLLSLLIVPEKTFRSIGLGASIVVVFAVAAGLTLLPAVLGLLGDRVGTLALRLPGRRGPSAGESAFWARAARLVMARPWISATVVVACLVAAVAPFFTMHRGFAGVGMVPHDTDVYRAYQILDREFSAGLVFPLEVAVDAPDAKSAAVQQGINRLVSSLQKDDAFGPPTVEVNQAGDLALVSVPVRGDFAANAAMNAVKRVRNQYIPDAFAGTDARVLVGGESALVLDILNMVSNFTPIVFAFVLGLSFLLLLLLFRSVVVPVSAIIMNLLSVGAAYGLLVLVFQHGFLVHVFGFRQVETIEFWIPLLLFACLFGLSMDYHVFLLSRIRERYDERGDNREAVSFGVRHTGRIITGAALIMVVVFAAFSMGRMAQLQQIGFGLAVAVIIDATVIRTVLVPAVMTLLGRWNWYLPKWLEWLPDLRMEVGVWQSEEVSSVGSEEAGGPG